MKKLVAMAKKIPQINDMCWKELNTAVKSEINNVEESYITRQVVFQLGDKNQLKSEEYLFPQGSKRVYFNCRLYQYLKLAIHLICKD